jgi:hypothetical protein
VRTFIVSFVLISVGILAMPSHATTLYANPPDVTAFVDGTSDFPIGREILSADAVTQPDLFAVAGAGNAAAPSCTERTGMNPLYGSFACLVSSGETLTPVGVSAFSQTGSPSAAAAIPEASTLVLLGSGLLVLWGACRRRIRGSQLPC